ncbi:MAG: AAA family ATPase [Egibacteraceae bacterium]
MICVGCGSQNAASSRFCASCGVQLGQACLACGFENPAESKFCGGCGARLQEVQAEDARGERRQLTVLFCDMVGSTALSQLLDPEDLGELIAAFQKICGNAVLAHEGHVAHYLGDGVVVYFGYPRSHEDEAQRAVRCGLDILEGVEALRDSGGTPVGKALNVRLGAHTGRVVVGPVGAGDRKDRIALGDAPNIANRIQSEAEPGTLVLSDVTWKIVDGYFAGKCLGEWQLKGVSKPMKLWLVTGESASRERVEVAGVLTPFIGREREQSVLERAWEESRAGRSRFILLRGDPGMGKSRLAQLFRDEVQFSADADLVGMRASPYNSNSPFHPVIELVERMFGLDHRQTLAERLDRIEAGLRGLGLVEPEAVVLLASLHAIPTNDRYTPLEISPARRRTRTMQLLVEFIAAIAEARPTLLLFEDLHWADTSTLEFLELLVTTTADASLMGLFTARMELDVSWMTIPALRTIDLTKFERAEAEAMVRGVASSKALPGDVLRQILARSDGVPLFIEELTRSVLDSGALGENGTWEAAGSAAAEIPVTMDASLTARIDRLGASRATAQLAAAIGREFSWALLLQVSERDEATLRKDLDRLLQAGLAWESGDERGLFVFRHALVRDAAYNSLLRSTRQRYHGRIASALRAGSHDQASARPDLIADHLTRAGEHSDAVDYWDAAGQQALARTAVHEAAEHFQRAITCMRRLPTTRERKERELDIQIRLFPLLMAVYGWGAVEVERACTRAVRLAEELQRHDLSYAPHWGLWTYRFLRGELASALETAESVFQMARVSGVPMIELTGRHAISYTLFGRGEYTRAIGQADAGLALYDFDQEKELVKIFGGSSTVCLRSSRSHSLWMLGRLDEATEECDRLLKLGRDLRHPPSLANALAFFMYGLAFRYSYIGQMERLLSIVDELLALSREENFFLWYAQAYTYRGVVAQALGDDRARRQMLEGLELWEQTGARATLVMMNVLCAEALYRLGDDDEAFRRLDVAEAEMARGQGMLAPDIWRVRGRLLARRGERSAAEAAYREAITRSRAQHALSLELRAALDLFELHTEDGHAEESRALLAGIVGRFNQGLDRPEVARARDIARLS